LETTEQANNRKRKIAEKKAEKQKLETTEQANNWKRKIAEKGQKREKWKVQNKQIIRREKLLKRWQKSKNWRHLNHIKKGLKKCLSILETKKNRNNRKIRIMEYHY
jgi:hypothetical protein